MKLTKVDLYLDWPSKITINNLRKFILKELFKKGKVIRWSIIEINNSVDPYTKKLRINAVIAK